MKVAAGIVLFNPNEARLKKNILSVNDQVDKIIFFDNGSNNISSTKKLIESLQINYQLIESPKNKGIAYALNAISKAAIEDTYEWLLTLDQDTVVMSDLIKSYSKYVDLPRVAQLSCAYKDVNSGEINNKIEGTQKYNIVDACITSGTLMNLNCYKKVGGFDNNLFIDCVDTEISYVFKKDNYLTYRINKVGMLHELGHIQKRNFLGFNISVLNYPPFRLYYIYRNQIIVSKRFPKDMSKKYVIGSELFVIFKILLYENSKGSKIKAVLSGIKDGLKYKNPRNGYNWR